MFRISIENSIKMLQEANVEKSINLIEEFKGFIIPLKSEDDFYFDEISNNNTLTLAFENFLKDRLTASDAREMDKELARLNNLKDDDDARWDQLDIIIEKVKIKHKEGYKLVVKF